MVFSGITFLIYYLPLFFIIYYLLPDKYKNGWLVMASLAFYSWGAPLFIAVVMLSCYVDYFFALKFKTSGKKLFFFLAIASNVLMLGYFKYANFFMENFNYIAQTLTGSTIPWAAVVLPIGISFLTFQKISFLTDVYRNDSEPQRNYWNYLLFVILFPHLIAGPIVRYKELVWQITHRYKDINPDNIYPGLFRFICGLSKKVLISNILGEHANSVFNNSGNADFTIAWTGIIAYTFQIYFDFSGYSDMAIGLARMMGFRIPENFHFPYTARSITEFWKRWHITLGNWMKDYIYIPLGGNRINENRTYINLFTVFLFSGLWHGASWNFVIWGAFHGTFLVMERLGLHRLLSKSGSFFSILYAFIVVLTGWVFFRITGLNEAVNFVSRMYSAPALNVDYLASLNPKLITAFIAALLFSFIPARYQGVMASLYEHGGHKVFIAYALPLAMVVLYAFNLGELFATGFNPFIYFQF